MPSTKVTDLDFEEDAPPLAEYDHPSEPESYAPVPYSPPLRVSPSSVGRMPPHSIEAEQLLLSSCMVDGQDVIRRCEQAGVNSDSFYLNAHATIFEVLVALLKSGAKDIDAGTVAEELKTRKLLNQIGGYPFLTQVSGRVPTTTQAGYFIEKVRELATLRAIIRNATAAVEDCYNYTGGIEEFAANVETRISSVTRAARKQAFAVAKSITSFGYPAGDDPNVLLGKDDYLGRGGGMLFVSHAGAGKSSFIMDACMSWGIGKPWMGIRSRGPLKSLIIQAEDSERYVGKVAASYVLSEQLQPSQIKQLGANCVIVKLVGISGPAFLAELARLVELHAPDLVVLNPLYLYADGDISKSECAQPFLVGLDAINRDSRFAYIIVHHTGKPQQKGTNGKRAELEDWETIYMGFGSSYLANWPRCSALLEPKTGQTGKYTLKLGKCGLNAGVTRMVDQGAGQREEPTTRVDLRHSKGTILVNSIERQAIYWELDADAVTTPVEGADEEAKKSAKKGQRASKYNYSQIREVIERTCNGEANAKGLNAIVRILENTGMGKSSVISVLEQGRELGLLQQKKSDLRFYVA